jgi:hypothetical protein
MYEEESGHMGINYLFKPYTSIIFTEEQLNVSMHFFYNAEISTYEHEKHKDRKIQNRSKINLFKYISDDDTSYSRTKELINNNKPVLAATDLFYMRYHQAYQKQHGLHYVVITGYDEEAGEFEVFDKYKLANSNFEGKLPIKEVNMARQSKNTQHDDLIGDYDRPILNSWTEVEIGNDFEINKEDILEIVEESFKRMKGEKNVLGLSCGINMIRACKENIESKKLEELNENNTYFFKSYYNQAFKVIARNRKRFKSFINEAKNIIHIESADKIETLLEESSNLWDINANLSYKLAISKKVSIIADICNKFDEIIEKESKVLDLLEDFINININ